MICAAQSCCRYGNELDTQATLQLLVDHVRASKAKQAHILRGMPAGMVLPGVELRHMLDLCLYFIPAHRLKVRACACVLACVRVCVCLCERERGKERGGPDHLTLWLHLCTTA